MKRDNFLSMNYSQPSTAAYFWVKSLTLLFFFAAALISGEESDGNPLVNPRQDPQAAKADDIAATMSGIFYFHGKIIDQNGQDVVGANISLNAYRIEARAGSVGVNSGVYAAATDKMGLFSFVDVKGYMFVIKAICPGYIIDNYGLSFNYQDPDTTKCDKLSAKDNPYIIHAWKVGAPSNNRLISIGANWENENLGVDEKKELYAKIALEFTGGGDANYLRRDPVLVRVPADGDWDVSLSMTAGSPDVGAPPFSGSKIKKLPPGSAIRVRARAGGIRQTDTTFPFMGSKREDLSPSIDLKWPGAKRIGNHAYFRILYHSDVYGYQSFLTIECSILPQSETGDCRLGFGKALPLAVPHVGVVNLLGSGLLEHFPGHAGQARSPDERKIERDSKIRTWSYQEAHLGEIRKTNPDLAREIEERMRSEGKEVPP